MCDLLLASATCPSASFTARRSGQSVRGSAHPAIHHDAEGDSPLLGLRGRLLGKASLRVRRSRERSPAVPGPKTSAGASQSLRAPHPATARNERRFTAVASTSASVAAP